MPNDQPSRARAFFDAIMQAGDDLARAAYIRAFVGSTPPTVETEFLDFKVEPQNPNDVARHWSEAIGGFANTEGGVIVWGIDARDDPTTGIDAAIAVRPISNVAGFTSRLKKLLPDTVTPPLQTVLIEPIADATAPAGQGFVVCYIPEGDFKPYRCEQKVGKPYMQRVEDDFRILNREMLASMFHPRLKPRFQLTVGLRFELKEPDNRGDYKAAMSFRCDMRNTGTATARECRFVLGMQSIPPERLEALPDFSEHQTAASRYFYAVRSIHPGTFAECCQAKWIADVINVNGTFHPADTFVRLRFILYAENTEPQEARFHFDTATLKVEENSSLVVETHPIKSMLEW